MASIGTSLSRDLQSRAQNLHANSTQLEKQEKELAKATEGLRKENEKLGKLVGEGQRKVKELGNVQNWAEMLERDFLVLGETMRLVRQGSASGSSYTGSSYTGSYSGSEDGERDAESLAGDERRGKVDGVAGGEQIDVDGEGDVQMRGDGDSVHPAGEVGEEDIGKGKGNAVETDQLMEHISTHQENPWEETTEAGQQAEHHAQPIPEAAGSSTTATVGSGSDPSSNSVHTSDSMAS